MKEQTPIETLIAWMDKNKTHCTYGTIRQEATKLFQSEKERDKRIASDFAEWCRTHAISGNDGFWHFPTEDIKVFTVISSENLYEYYLSQLNKQS